MTREAQYFAIATLAVAVGLSVLSIWLWRKSRAAELKYNATWQFWAPILTGYCAVVMIRHNLGSAPFPQPGAGFVLAAGVAGIIGSELGRAWVGKIMWAISFAVPIGLLAVSWYLHLLSLRDSFLALLVTVGLQTWWVYKGRYAFRHSDV